MKCKCGFKFSEPGEYRNCEAFITDTGRSGVICPKCGKQYIDGEEVKLKINEDIGVNTPAGIIEPFTDNSIPICYRCGCKITKENKSMIGRAHV